MEQLVLEVQQLRKQVRFQGQIIAAFVAVALVTLVFPHLRKQDSREFVVSTELLRASQIRLTDEEGNTAVLTSDSLTFNGPSSSRLAGTVSIGVDEDRQPNVLLSFQGDDKAGGRARSATMMIHRNLDGTPDAAFIDPDGRDIPWIED